MVLPSIDPIGFLLAIFDSALDWLRHILDLLLSIATPTAVVHVLSSSTQPLSPVRTLSMWIHGAGITTKSKNSAILNTLEKGAFFFDRSLGILTRLPSSLESTNTSTSGGEAFPDLPFFKATLISVCLMFVVYRAYKYGRAVAINDGPTGAVAEIVAALSSENHELRFTIDSLTARINDQDQDGTSSPPAPGVYVFNAGTASSVATPRGLTADSLNTPHPSSANLPEASPSHHGSYMNDTTRRRRRSLSADAGTRRLRRKTHTVETGLYDFAI